MLLIVCLLYIWLNFKGYIGINWWFLVLSLIIAVIVSILELILIFKEIRYSMKDTKVKNKKYN